MVQQYNLAIPPGIKRYTFSVWYISVHIDIDIDIDRHRSDKERESLSLENGDRDIYSFARRHRGIT